MTEGGSEFGIEEEESSSFAGKRNNSHEDKKMMLEGIDGSIESRSRTIVEERKEDSRCYGEEKGGDRGFGII